MYVGVCRVMKSIFKVFAACSRETNLTPAVLNLKNISWSFALESVTHCKSKDVGFEKTLFVEARVMFRQGRGSSPSSTLSWAGWMARTRAARICRTQTRCSSTSISSPSAPPPSSTAQFLSRRSIWRWAACPTLWWWILRTKVLRRLERAAALRWPVGRMSSTPSIHVWCTSRTDWHIKTAHGPRSGRCSSRRGQSTFGFSRRHSCWSRD